MINLPTVLVDDRTGRSCLLLSLYQCARRNVSLPEHVALNRLATICVRAAKVYRATATHPPTTTPARLGEGLPLERKLAETAFSLHARAPRDDTVVSSVDVDLQQLVFEGSAVAADVECAIRRPNPFYRPSPSNAGAVLHGVGAVVAWHGRYAVIPMANLSAADNQTLVGVNKDSVLQLFRGQWPPLIPGCVRSFPANMLHIRLADGYYAPHSIAPAGSFLR